MDHAHTKPRRRVSRRSPTGSSSDELAVVSNHEPAHRHRQSWSRNFTPQRPTPQKRPPSRSESPDELAVDADEYWRSSRTSRSRHSPSKRSAAPSSPGRTPSEDASNDRMSTDEGRTDNHSDPSDRLPTPAPPAEPPLPPKPDRLNYREKFVLKAHQRGVSSVQFSPDCTMIASGGADATVKVWETATGKPLYTFVGHLAGISTVAWSPDGKWVASGSDDKTIRFWSIETGRAHTKIFKGHHNYIYQIAFTPKGNMLASGSYDEAVFLWDVRRAKVMRSLPAHSDPVAGMDVVHDGTLVASCATDGLVRIWDTHTGQCLRTLVHEDNPPATFVKFSPNGKYILAWTLDGCIRLWNYVESRVIKTFQGHENKKYSISGGFGTYGPPDVKYNPPLAFAVSGSEDGAIVCWDIVTKNILQRIEGHTDVVLGVHTGQLNGKRMLVSGGLDRTVRVWEEQLDEGVNGDAAGPDSAPDSNLPPPTPVNGADGEDTTMADAPPESSVAGTPAGDVTMT